MSLDLPSLNDVGDDIQDIKNYLYKFDRALKFLLEGNLSTKNIREVGGWQATEDDFMSVDGDVGFSTEDTVANDIRIWAGNTVKASAPFRVYEDGSQVVSNITINGGSINWTGVTPPTATDTGSLPFDSPIISQLSSVGIYNGLIGESQVSGLPDRVSNLSAIGDYIGAMSQGQVTGLSTRLTNITPTGVFTGTVGTDQLVAGVALIGVGLIEELIVGTNVTMGSSATITWDNVTGTKPPSNADNTDSALSSALGSNYTTIGSTYVYTGTVTASQINTVNLAAEKIYKPGETASYLAISGYGDMVLSYAGSPFFTIENTIDGVNLIYEGTTIMRYSDIDGGSTSIPHFHATFG